MTRFQIRDPRGLNYDFYTRFDEGFILRKVETLLFVAQEFDSFKKLVQEKGGEFEWDAKKYPEGLRAEVHFSEMHQAESLFALILAIFQPLPHWLYLTSYTTKEIKAAITDFLNYDVAKLTNGKLRTPEAFVSHGVYMGFRANDPEKAAMWSKNLSNIAWLLKNIYQKFLESEEYNAYKHGLRVMTGETGLAIHPDDRPDLATTLAYSEDSITYLEVKKVNNGMKEVYQTVKHFSHTESYNNIRIMHSLLKTIKSTRLAKLTDKPGAEIQTFFELDRDVVMSHSAGTKWSISV